MYNFPGIGVDFWRYEQWYDVIRLSQRGIKCLYFILNEYSLGQGEGGGRGGAIGIISNNKLFVFLYSGIGDKCQCADTARQYEFYTVDKNSFNQYI